jgi:hypothetical protein
MANKDFITLRAAAMSCLVQTLPLVFMVIVFMAFVDKAKARNNGISRKEARARIREAVAKIPRARGLAAGLAPVARLGRLALLDLRGLRG